MVPRLSPPAKAHDITLVSQVVATAFNQRRKTLSNSLKKMISEEKLKSLSIDPIRRAETLSVSEFVNIANIANTL